MSAPGPAVPEADAPLRVVTLDARQWAAEAPAFADHNYRQSWSFGRACAARVGAASEHVAIRRGDETVALCDVRVRRLTPLGGGIAYVNGGPLLRREGVRPDGLRREVLEALSAEYARRRGLILRVAPPLDPEAPDGEAPALEALGFTAADLPAYRTFLLDVTPPVETLRAQLAQKWRNGLNGSEKQGLEVETGEDPALFDAFVALFDRFRERKPFEVDLDAAFYRDAQRDALPAERFVVSLATRNGEAVGGHVASCLGDTSVYLLGATLEEGLKAKAGYLLQWHAILEAKRRGMRFYDLGGIDPEGNPGVHRFKKGLSGFEARSAGPFELVPRHPAVWLTRLAERGYRSLRRRGAGR